ncbi:cell division regulator GpsB [Lacticaseibacillus pantheris]|jgi:DivIVA domain-containing protein|uniref:Cell cycle protein GpsB n=1 Tax=Lacticaseibacillus pantheris DSM 15945 = JCM 12539 = NBRC 106106 TaxID=1423783 RepID=A0A0R1TW87_9LACO|nr:cell division regulator GpsB [Lacticaseibacillus pantheris]KRL85447.1 cell division initiation protein DivIVA [Lacticaseibacillus pantheris DSM 15945 = JCM 12539 = NBRC 106106]WKF84380.1 cell division regulator GpsB [Lacticaseibacillus pantheris]
MDAQNDGQMNVHYTPQDILNKQFKSKMRGYDQDEVDSFLDDIIKDYEAFEKEITSGKEENARLISRVDELTKQLNVSKGVAAQTPQANVAATNYDILKRLSNLERHVFGSKLSDGGAHAATPNSQRPE